MITSLKRVDPERHMDRWYTVAVQPTLLDEVAVICAWGSRHSRYQRWRALPATTAAEAKKVAEQIIQAKTRRGYQSVS